MARIRSLKPEFFSSEQVVSVGPWARLLFQGLWVFGDDEGRGKASAIEMKAKIFPGDPFPASKVESFLQELVEVGLVVLYTSGGVRYWSVPGFKKHQYVNRPQASRCPPPPVAGTEPSAPITEPSRSDQGSVAVDPVTAPASRASDPSPSIPIHPIPALEGVQGEPPERPPGVAPLASLTGWGRHLAAVPVAVTPEPWRCAEQAYAAFYQARRRQRWRTTSATHRVMVELADIASRTAHEEGLTCEATIDRALANFGRDPFAQKADWPPSLLVNQWNRHWNPPAAGLAPTSASFDENDLERQMGMPLAEVANG